MEIQVKRVNELWSELCSVMEEDFVTTDALVKIQRRYTLLLRFMGVACAYRANLWQKIISNTEAEKFIEETRRQILKGTTADERYHYRALSNSDLANYIMIKDMLEDARRFENILRGFAEIVKVEVGLSYKGHD